MAGDLAQEGGLARADDVEARVDLPPHDAADLLLAMRSSSVRSLSRSSSYLTRCPGS
jgi:hypothetical protein